MSSLPQRIRCATIQTRRRMLKPLVGWCNRNLSQRNLRWIADHSLGWTRINMVPISIPGTPYTVTDVKIMDWVARADLGGEQ